MNAATRIVEAGAAQLSVGSQPRRRSPGRAAKAQPHVGIVLSLALEELVAGGAPGADVTRQVVEHEIAAVGLDGQHGVSLAVEIADDRHQQRLTWKTPLDEELALEQRIDFAVALAVDRIIPM